MRVLTLWCCTVAASAVDPFDLVEWEDLKLRPDANLVYLEDRLVVHPRARLTTGYDTNSTQRANPHDEGFIGVALGATAVWLPIEDQRFQAEGIIEAAKSDRYQAGDLPLLASFAWDDQGEPWIQHAEGRVRRNDAPSLVQTGRQIYRNEWNFSYDGTLDGDAMSVGGGPFASRIQFLDDGLEFDGNERDQEQYGGLLHWGWQRSLESQVDANVSAGVQRYDDSFTDGAGPYPNGRFVRGQAAWLLPVGDRTSLRVTGGATHWTFSDPWNGDTDRDDQDSVVVEGGLNLHWDWEEDSFVEAHLTRDAVPGVNANLAVAEDAGIFGRLAILQSWGVDGELGMTRVTESSAPLGEEVERRWGYRAGVGAELYFDNGWLWRAAVNYSDSRARVAESFTRTLAMIQVTIAY